MFIFDTNLKPEKIYLSSKNYNSKYLSNNYFYELNQTIRKYSNMDMTLRCESFTFTNTIYNINDNNNWFSYNFLGANYNVKIVNGNYDIDQLLDNLNIRCSGDLNFSYNPNLLKIIINSVRSGNVPFKLVNKEYSIFKTLGFDMVFSDDILYSSITSNTIFNLNSNISLNIILDNISVKSNSVKNQSLNVIENITILSAFGEVQSFVNHSNFHHLIDNDNISSIGLNILNQDFLPVVFNNSEWYMVISVNFMYKKELKIPENYFNNNSLHNNLTQRLLDIEKDDILNKNNNI